MVRIKYSLLAKLFAFVFFLLFILPSLLNLFNNNSSNEYSNDLNVKKENLKHDVEVVHREGRRSLDQNHPELEAIFKDGEFGNYEDVNPEPRSGPGEGGTGVTLDQSEKSKADKTVREFGFNMVASDKISLDRRIKDTRNAECKYWHYPHVNKLPTASVVIVFVNEGWSTLMRTVHSVLNTSPPELIAEIIMVDDFSSKDFLKDNLDNYVKRFNGKVKVVRTTKREGLVRARVIGAEHATGQVIVILDAHCECVTNWLPPLLTRIAVNRKTLAVPIVDGIEWNTLEHRGYSDDTRSVGIFEWGFLYKEMRISNEDFAKKKRASQPTLKTIAVPIVDSIKWQTLEHRSVYGDRRFIGIFEWGFLYKEKLYEPFNNDARVSAPYKKILAVPIVDGIDWNTLEHTDIYGGALNRGIFEWGFLYKETEVPDQERKRHSHFSEPYWSPTHAGGLLAIDKEWFFELGGYDPGIKIWGAEQYELSFKVWQCGGTVEWVPCSHVAHIYRGPRTESVHPADGNPHQASINHMRLAEVWMDEYKEYYYIREPQIRSLDFGDVAPQKAIREKLQCKSFKWFMENVAYDLVKKFPLPPKNVVWGECKNKKHDVCMDVRGAGFGQPIGVSGCHHQLGNQCRNPHNSVCISSYASDFGQPLKVFRCSKGSGQLFRLNVQGELSSGEHCFVSDKNIVKKKFCLDYQGIWNPVGEWSYNLNDKMIKSNKEKTCLTTNGSDLKLEICDDSNLNQKWEWTEIYY